MRDDIDEELVKTIEIEEGSYVDDLLRREGIEPQEVLVSRDDTILSGRHQLNDGDEIEVFKVIAGG